MVQLIIGNKGRGKTRYLLEKVNSEVKDTLGNICYLDKSSKHMFELNNRVRLINVSDFAIENTDQFIGFICGIISQDHDIEQMYIDGLMKIAKLTPEAFEEIVERFENISDKFDLRIIVSASIDKSELSPAIQEKVIVAL